MVALCRHIMPSNSHCGSPALKGQDFCFNHQLVKRTTKRRPRSPNDFTYVIPFIYPEDRAAINYNLFLVLQAQAEHKIDTRTASSMTANLRAAATNLNRGPLLEENRANAVQRVILTPEGDEIAPPRDVLEEGESAPIHHKGCPCQRCAEEFRGAPPEQHHADCKCGFCDEPIDQAGPPPLTNGCHPERSEMKWSEVEGPAFSRPSHENGCPILDAPLAARACPEPAEGVGEYEPNDPAEPQPLTSGCHPERSEGSAVSLPSQNNGCPILDASFAARACPEPAEGVGEYEPNDPAEPQPLTNGCHPERSETKWSEVEGPAVSLPSQNNGCPISRRDVGGENVDPPGAKRACLEGQSRIAPAAKLHSYELTTNSATEEEKFFNNIYRDQIEKHKADYTARARAANEAGLEPPPYEPFDPDKIEPKAERLYKETMAEVEKNREAARQAWNRLHPDKPVEYTPYVSWADEEELRREQWKKLREQGEQQAAATSELIPNG